MLDPQVEEPVREQIAQEVQAKIEASGELGQQNTWGVRKMAYEINKRTEADYRWYRFQAPRELLGELDHSLKIADGILRFRVFKVDPDTPAIAAPPAVGAPAPPREDDDEE